MCLALGGMSSYNFRGAAIQKTSKVQASVVLPSKVYRCRPHLSDGIMEWVVLPYDMANRRRGAQSDAPVGLP